MKIKPFLFLPLVGALAAPVWAEELHYNLVSFQESASATVERDELVVLFSVNEKGTNRNQVISKTTDKLNRFLRTARTHRDFNTSVENRRSEPWREYANNKWQDKGWQDTVTVRVSSKNPQSLLAFAAQVQALADVDNMNYQVSDNALKNIKNSLTEEAIARFRQRADQITRALGKHSYRIVNLNINNAGGNFARFVQYDSAAVSLRAAKAAPVQENAPGEAQVELNVSGQIQTQD